MSLKIFVTGASGFIGQAVAIGFRRAGYQVYGLVRSAEKGRELALNEVNVVIGDVTKPETYLDVARKCSVLIHTAVDYTNYDTVDSTALKTLLQASTADSKKVLLWTSGILVYPGSDRVVTEDDPVFIPEAADPVMLPRIRNENAVLKATEAHGVVVRPAFVFGGTRGHFYDYFKQAQAGKVVVNGKPEITWSEVHIEDLVDGYIKIAQAAPSVVSGQVFNFADSSRNSNYAIAKAFARVAGFTGEIESGGPIGWAQFGKTVIVGNEKTRRLLGWVPRHVPLLDEVEVYYNLWKAHTAAK